MPKEQADNPEVIKPNIAGSDAEEIDTASAFADLFKEDGKPDDADAQKKDEQDKDSPPQNDDEKKPELDEKADAGQEASPAQSEESELEKLRRENAELAQYYRSNEGRVSALQKKINDTETELTESKEKVKSLENPVPELSDEDRERFQKDYGEVSDFLKAESARLRTEIREDLKQEFSQDLTPFQDKLQKLDEMEKRQARTEQFDVLRKAHPDFETIQEDQNFWGWINSQPPGIQHLVNSPSAADNIALIDLYKSQNPPESKPDLSEHESIPSQGAKPAPADEEDVVDPAAYFAEITSKR